MSLIAGLALTGIVRAAEPGIIVIGTDGSRQEIALTALDRITLGTSDLKVQTKAGDTTYAYSSIDRILLGQTVSALKDITANGNIAVWPTVTSSNVNISGAVPGTPVKVYGVDGSLVTSAVTADDTTVLDITAARTGVCIVTVGTHSVKILKK